MLKVGLIGLGFMGRGHVECYRRLEAEGFSVRLAAVCDADAGRLEGRDIVTGNIGVGDSVDLSAYAGSYVLAGDVAHLEVSTTAGGIQVTLTEVPDFTEDFALVASHTFSFATDPGRTPMLFFSTTPDGQVDSVKFLSYIFRRQTETTPARK